MNKSISFNLVSKIFGYICTKRNSRLVVRWPTKKSAKALGTRMTVGGFLYFICMISFLFGWFLFNFCGFFLFACFVFTCMVLFFIGVFSIFYLRVFFFICVVSFQFLWFLFVCMFRLYLYGSFFIGVFSFLFAWFHFYLRGFIFIA